MPTPWHSDDWQRLVPAVLALAAQQRVAATGADLPRLLGQAQIVLRADRRQATHDLQTLRAQLESSFGEALTTYQQRGGALPPEARNDLYAPVLRQANARAAVVSLPSAGSAPVNKATPESGLCVIPGMATVDIVGGLRGSRKEVLQLAREHYPYLIVRFVEPKTPPPRWAQHVVLVFEHEDADLAAAARASGATLHECEEEVEEICHTLAYIMDKAGLGKQAAAPVLTARRRA